MRIILCRYLLQSVHSFIVLIFGHHILLIKRYHPVGFVFNLIILRLGSSQLNFVIPLIYLCQHLPFSHIISCRYINACYGSCNSEREINIVSRLYSTRKRCTLATSIHLHSVGFHIHHNLFLLIFVSTRTNDEKKQHACCI